MSKKNNMSSFGTFILLFFIMMFAMASCNSDSDEDRPDVIIGSSLESMIESHGYDVKNLIKSDTSDKYYALINGHTAVIDDASNQILVMIYDDDNNLIDSFVITKY